MINKLNNLVSVRQNNLESEVDRKSVWKPLETAENRRGRETLW